MDKWEALGMSMIAAMRSDNEEQGMRVLLTFVKEFGRAIEDVGAQLDRIATVLERQS